MNPILDRASRLGWLAALLILASSVPAAAEVRRQTRGEGAPPIGVHDLFEGCCDDPDVLNFGNHLDFNSILDGQELHDQYRSSGVLFGRAASLLAPIATVEIDYSRPSQCWNVVTGDPIFTGWVFLTFVDPVANNWARAQKVGIDVGYCDFLQSLFIAAYDSDGNLLEAKFNDRKGFQFLGIERPTAEISRVLIGACAGGAVGQCYPDEGGSGFNCLTFSTPVPTSIPLPASIPMPPAPTIQGMPAAGTGGLMVASILLAATSVWVIRRRTLGTPRARG